LNLSIDDIELVNTTLASRTIRVNGVAIGIGNKYKISILGD
jgi:hypothetical protein